LEASPRRYSSITVTASDPSESLGSVERTSKRYDISRHRGESTVQASTVLAGAVETVTPASINGIKNALESDIRDRTYKTSE